MIRGLDVAQAVRAMARALASPYEVSGSAHAPRGIGGEGGGRAVTMLRVEGFADSVAYRVDKLKALLGDAGEVSVEADPGRSRAIWVWVRDVEGFAGTTGDLWRISVKPSDAVAVAVRLKAGDLLFDWGGGLIWAEVTPGTDLRGLLEGIAGHATRVRGAGTGDPAFPPEPAPVAGLTRGLRAKFDPRGILNPGLMG
jgi:glycolate oxidase FAD binding subunit